MAEQEQSVEPFKREERYIVIKRKRLTPLQEMALRAHLEQDGISIIEGAVIESDWPEYETVWAMIERRMFTPTPDAVNADKALMPEAAREAIVLIDELNERKPSREFYGIGQVLHAKLCTVRATLARALATTPTPVEEPEKGATGEGEASERALAILAEIDNTYASYMGDPDGNDDIVTAKNAAALIIDRFLAATNAGQVEAAQTVSQDRAVEVVARALAECDGITPNDGATYAFSTYGPRARAAIAAFKKSEVGHEA